MGDYDADGYPDFVLQGYNNDEGRYVKVLHNRQGNGFEMVQKVTQVSEGGVSFGDFNADGLLDLVTVGYGDGPELRFFRGTGDATTLASNVLTLRFDDIVTNVTNTATQQSGPAYNLKGQRVTNDANGVVIKNGKVIVK